MKSYLTATTALAAAWLAGPAFAQEAAPTDLDEVVVTATRLPAIVAETPGARVIDAATIEQRGTVFAADILADVPGLSVTRTGTFGGVAQVRMRGATPGKTLVLIDGAPVNDAAEPNGAFDFSGLELGDIERIEVLSGPQSSLWGSDAIGGVIAFTTRELNGFRAEAEAGSFSTLRGRLAAGVADDRYAFGAFVSRFDTDGVSAADEADGNPEDDGYENTTVGVKGRYALSPSAEVFGSLRWSDGEVEIDGFPAPSFALADTLDSSATEQASGVIGVAVQALGLSHRLSVSGSDIERETVSDFSSTFRADRQAFRWQADGKVADRVDVAFGLEHEDSEGSISTGDDVSLSTSSAFGVARFDVTEALSVTGALRYDDTDDFGAETTGRVSAALRFGAGFMLSGAYGTGFKAPTVSQAVCDFCFSSQPFPVLRPESADGVEAAIGWSSDDGRFSGRATLYRLNVEDQITYIFDSVTFDSFYVNIDETRTDGVELEANADLGSGFDLTLAYAWTDARDRSDDSRLLRVPEHSGSATLAWKGGGWTGERLSGALTVRAEDDQDDAGGVREGFVVANLSAAYRLTDAVSLAARIENLTDERYQQVLGYGEPGLSAYAGIRLRY